MRWWKGDSPNPRKRSAARGSCTSGRVTLDCATDCPVLDNRSQDRTRSRWCGCPDRPNIRRTKGGSMASQVDSLDEQILAALQANGRLTMKALAEQVGLSSPAMIERVRRLEERGVIAGYR